MGTIKLIDSLDPESKKVLNSLVQSVLITQQENDKNKLELMRQERQLITAKRTMMQEMKETEEKKFELQQMVKDQQTQEEKIMQL